MARALMHGGSAKVDAGHQALAVAYRQVLNQATQLAYLDALRQMAIVVACMLPLLLFARAPKRGQAAMVH
jgi:hypothetical protein